MRAILFDMDGVVIDSEPLYERVQERGLAQYGIQLSRSDYLNFKGLSEAMVFDILEQDYGIKWDRERVQRESRAILLEEFRQNLKFMEGFPEIINNFSNGYIFGLVTSTGRDFLDEVDKILPVKKYFQEIVAGGDTSDTKPHPGPYLEMMRRLEVEPHQALVIEDSINGIRSGKMAGAAVIGLAATYHCEELAEADICVKSLKDITTNIVERLFDG